MRKILMSLLSLALLITSVIVPAPAKTSAASNVFVMSESTNIAAPRVTYSQITSMSGTVLNANRANVRYTVDRITAAGGPTGPAIESNPGQTAGIFVDTAGPTTSPLTISGMSLYKGLNRIVIYDAVSSSINDTYFIEVRDANYFSFPSEQYSPGSARIVLDDRVNLTGSINNVIGSSITYSIYNIVMDGATERVVGSNKNENITTNINLSGSSISILGLQLYPGLNKITFKGLQGLSEVENSIYIEYRNSPSLYDLQAIIDGQRFDISETGSTVIQSTPSRNRDQYDISIIGKAPNADKVTVTANGNSYSYTVSSSNGWQFAVSPVNVKKGLNTITIKVINNNQVVETKRDITFYNGQVTFYDMKLNSFNGATPTGSTPLDNSPNFSVASGETIKVTGKAILPMKATLIDPDGSGPDPAVMRYFPNYLDLQDADISGDGAGLEISKDSGPYLAATTVAFAAGQPTPIDSTQFITVDFSYTLPAAVGAAGSLFNTTYSLKFHGTNNVKTPVGPDESGLYTYRLRDGNQAYISEINYLTGYNNSTSAADLEALTGSSLNGANVFSLPLGIEFLIGNPKALGAGNNTLPTSIPSNLITIPQVAPNTGVPTSPGDGDATGASLPASKYSYLQLPSAPYYVTRTVGGVEQQFLRVFMKVVKLPSSGGQTLSFQLDSSVDPNVSTDTPTAAISLLFGPSARYNKVYDGMNVNYDTTISTSAGKALLLDSAFDQFRGELINVSNPSDIRYVNGGGANTQTVFFYINNVEVKLEADGASLTKFRLDDDPSNQSNAFDAIFKGGDNTFRFVFRTPSNTYEKSIKVSLIPTNLPKIPVDGTTGVFPYSINSVPLANDPKFVKEGPIYKTKEAKMNIYGSFDFIDLGQTSGAVDGALATMSVAAKNNYILLIKTDNNVEYRWTLNNRFESDDATHTPLNGAGTLNPDIGVYYNFKNQTFAFNLQNQDVPSDGSSKVYNIYVYNSGESGPKAQFRLEIDPTSIPYTILAPVVERRTLNQNYVEVILTSPGAETVTINKTVAHKITYLNYGNMQGGVPEKIDAYSALVTGLKSGKETAIALTITRGEDQIKDSFKVMYAAENLPGAEYLETIKKSHKLFDGKLTLALPSTNLIRRDFNVPENLKGQVYTGNNILFGIANPEDGVLDRNDFTPVPPSYDLQVDLGNTYFRASFPSRFIKISPVYWMDAGQADNQTTPGYDPQAVGIDPYSFSVEDGITDPFFYNRDKKREIVPAKRGTMTISYDSSVRQEAGTLVTVFRFDPFALQWENIGGVVDTKKAAITVPFDRFGYYVVAKLSYGFQDINDHPYARNALEAIYSKGVMNPEDPSGAFGTDQYVSRGEFARMLVRALQLPFNYFGNNHFIDATGDEQFVNMNDKWDFRYIETAARAGIVAGTQPRVFEPNRSLSRQDAAVMLAKALNLKLDTKPASVQKALQKAFIDEASIGYYAKPSVAAILKKGFISGSPVDASDPKTSFVFEPNARLLRSDAAIVIARVMADLKKLPVLYTK